MKIGFVVEPYEESHTSGMGYSVIETMRHLPLEGPEHSYVFYSSRPISSVLLPADSTNRPMPKGFVQQFFYFMQRPKNEIDVLLFVAPLLPLIVPRRIRTVLLCKDLASFVIGAGSIREYLKILLRDRVLMRWCLARASLVAASSEATRRDLVAIYGVPTEKIVTTYEGFQDFSNTPEEPIEVSPAPYFFFTGKVKQRKNVHGIAAGFVAFKKRTHSDCRLVISGDSGGAYHERIVRILREGGVEDQVRFVGYVSKGQLRAWYTHALGVVFPSFNEGFGMPILEAMRLGAPVITSNISSMQEVAGDAALLVDPHDVAAIGAAMEKIATDAALRNELINKGRTRSEDFSWRRTARRILDAIETHVR